MKKHLIAVAVATAFTAPAIAQVTVYGAIDIAARSYDTGSVKNTALIDSRMRTTRLGVRGTEDLGGGLKAEFMLQGSFDPSGVVSGTTTANTTTSTPSGSTVAQNDGLGAFKFNEEAWVGISGGFGHVRLGRTDTTGLQGLDSTVAGPDFFTSVSGTGEIGNNLGQVIRYISPRVGGFAVEVGVKLPSEEASTAKNAVEGQQGVFASYIQGPLGIYAGTSRNTKASTADGKRTYDAVGLTYDFGVARVGFLSSKADTSSTDNLKDAKQNILNVAVPMGSGMTIRAAYMNAKEGGTANDKADGYSLVLQKDMSKRTTVYAQYTSVDNESAATRSWAGTTQSGSAAGDPTAMMIGVSHSF